MAVHAPIGEGHVHAEARADLDQQRHEQRQARLHRLDLHARHLGEHARLRIGFGHHGAAGGFGKLGADVGDARLELLRLAPDASSAVSLWNCWQYSRADLPVTSVHSLGHEPVALRLEHVEFGRTVSGGRCAGIHASWSCARLVSARMSL